MQLLLPILGLAATAAPHHPANWYAGWSLILAGFVMGGALGLFFHKPEFLGGYDSWRRRLLRLGHIACEALGFLNLIVALSPWPAPGSAAAAWASGALILGGLSMPVVCWLSAWRPAFRHLFPVLVVALTLAAVLAMLGGG